MLGFRHGRFGARRVAGAIALALAATLPGLSAAAQPYGGGRGYEGGPAYYEDERVNRTLPRRASREPAGFNCAAVQQGITGPQPYSCPLPGPRPLGTRCFCNLPIASFSPPQTAVGHVVP